MAEEPLTNNSAGRAAVDGHQTVAGSESHSPALMDEGEDCSDEEPTIFAQLLRTGPRNLMQSLIEGQGTTRCGCRNKESDTIYKQPDRKFGGEGSIQLLDRSNIVEARKTDPPDFDMEEDMKTPEGDRKDLYRSKKKMRMIHLTTTQQIKLKIRRRGQRTTAYDHDPAEDQEDKFDSSKSYSLESNALVYATPLCTFK
ncbi:MAG: hypothetical protein M1836_002603 [Candelina mexicana]|nr:MAG: hypothetical protein M1836_002603 [Candelina mexicana]